MSPVLSISDAVGGESNTGPACKGVTVQWDINRYVEGGDFQVGKIRPSEGNFMQVSDQVREPHLDKGDERRLHLGEGDLHFLCQALGFVLYLEGLILVSP